MLRASAFQAESRGLDSHYPLNKDRNISINKYFFLERLTDFNIALVLNVCEEWLETTDPD